MTAEDVEEEEELDGEEEEGDEEGKEDVEVEGDREGSATTSGSERSGRDTHSANDVSARRNLDSGCGSEGGELLLLLSVGDGSRPSNDCSRTVTRPHSTLSGVSAPSDRCCSRNRR
jgi:hypothetical protein